jgi:hypothetical protein
MYLGSAAAGSPFAIAFAFPKPKFTVGQRSRRSGDRRGKTVARSGSVVFAVSPPSAAQVGYPS